jgi:hypothetical protein
VLLERTPNWLPWLRWTVVIAGIAAAIALVVSAWIARWTRSRFAIGALVVVATLAALGGPLAYTVATAAQPHTGPIVAAGPSGTGGSMGGPGGGFGGGPGGGQSPPGLGGQPPQLPAGATASNAAGGTPPSGPPTQGMGTGAQGGAPGGGATTVDSALVSLLQKAAATHRWAAAMTSASNAASYQLGSGAAIMAIGGFNGTDQSMTLADFEQLVTKGDIGYYIAGGGFANSANQGVASEIATWVQQHYTATTVGSATIYDLSGLTTASAAGTTAAATSGAGTAAAAGSMASTAATTATTAN